jgi:hypothetical protein
MIIYIINQYASNTVVGDGSKHYYLAKELVKMGHEVYVVSASFTHYVQTEIDQKENVSIELVNGINHVYIRTLSYNNKTSFKRVLNWFLFTYRVSKLYKFISRPPSIIIASSPSPFVFLGAYYLAKKFKAKIFFEIRDFWPLTLIKFGNYSVWNPLIILMQLVENFAIKKSDAILSSLPFAYKYKNISNQYKKKYYHLPNGFDMNELLSKPKIPRNIYSAIPKDKFIVGYVGSCGSVNALNILLRSAELLKNDKSIRFVIIGRGMGLDELRSEAEKKKLINIIFINHINKKYIQSVLQLFDVCYIGWQNKSLYRFGVSPQKLPEYLFSGKPIIHSYSGMGCAVKDAEAGISVPAEDFIKVKEAVLKLKGMSVEQRIRLGINGKNYSIKNYDYKKISIDFEKFMKTKI